MRLTHLGHACLLIETPGARLLIDPGSFSAGFESLTDLDAIAVTHQHPDHLDPERASQVIAASPGARLLIEPETAAAHSLDGAVTTGSRVQVGDLTIEVVGGQHATNHDLVAPIGNVGFVIAQSDGPRLFHPGDSYADAPPGIDVLGLPLNGPWCRMSETLTFLRTVSPATVVPIHDGLLSPAGRATYLMHVRNFGPEAAEVTDLSDSRPYDVR